MCFTLNKRYYLEGNDLFLSKRLTNYFTVKTLVDLDAVKSQGEFNS